MEDLLPDGVPEDWLKEAIAALTASPQSGLAPAPIQGITRAMMPQDPELPPLALVWIIIEGEDAYRFLFRRVASVPPVLSLDSLAMTDRSLKNIKAIELRSVPGNVMDLAYSAGRLTLDLNPIWVPPKLA